MPSIGERLGELQEAAGLTSRQSDRLAGKSEGQAAIIRARHRDVYVGTLFAYAELYGVTLDWLVAGRGEAPRPEDVRTAVRRAEVAKKRSRSRDTKPPSRPRPKIQRHPLAKGIIQRGAA